MRKLMLASVVLGLIVSCAPAAMPQAVAATPIQPKPANIIPDGFNIEESCETLEFMPDGEANAKLIGIFPKQDNHINTIRKSYFLECPTFTVERNYRGTTVFRGLHIKELVPLFYTPSHGQSFSYTFGLSEDAFIDLTTPGTVQVANAETSKLPTYPVAVKVEGKELQPLLFNGQAYTVHYDPSETVEILRPDLDAYGYNWTRMSWDAAQNIFILDPNNGLD